MSNGKTLVVSTYPPFRCGIGAYAYQLVESRTRAGEHIDVMSLNGEGCVDYPLDFQKRADAWAAFAIMLGYDEIVVNFAPGLVDRTGESHLREVLTRLVGLAKKHVDVIVHEVEYPTEQLRLGEHNRFWAAMSSLTFHTESERTRFLETFKSVSLSNTRLVQHHEHFVRFFNGSREEARRQLGLPPDETIFVSAGFIQRHKGFDRVVRVFEKAMIDRPDTRYYIVGSLRVQAEELISYLEDLRDIVRPAKRTTLIEKFVDDVDFDRWLTASDFVVLPYREIWSSGVLARARLLDRRIIAARVGGMAEQLRPEDLLFDDDGQLAEILKNAKAEREPPASRRKARRAEERPIKLAFAMPRIGENFIGGAESFVRKLTRELAKRGNAVDVWATTTSSMEQFNDEYPEGESTVDGVNLRRFKSNAELYPAFARLHARMHRPNQGRLLPYAWSATSISSKALLNHARAHAYEYDAVCWGQSLFGLAQHGILATRQNAVLHPFLHDELPAGLPPVQRAWRAARAVMFNVDAERDLAPRLGLYNANAFVVGVGVDDVKKGEPSRFRAEFGVAGPYIVYAGRFQETKNLKLLEEGVRAYRERHGRDLRLVVIGDGTYKFENDVTIVRNATDEQKWDVMAGAIALVQPSVFESFSLVIMESWQQKRPVLVHNQCGPTREAAARADGGLWFNDAKELAIVLRYLVENPEHADVMGEQGAEYVERMYAWSVVCERYEEALRFVRDQRRHAASDVSGKEVSNAGVAR